MVGSGYVGLVSGAYFADSGHEVVCIDKDQGKIDRLNEGGLMLFHDFFANGLVRGMVAARAAKNLRKISQFFVKEQHIK